MMMIFMGIGVQTWAQSKELPPLPPVPHFYSAQYIERDFPMPPLPFNPMPERKVYDLGNGDYAYEDRDISYDLLREEARLEALAVMAATGVNPLESPGTLALDYGPTDLYLKITEISNNEVHLDLHTTSSDHYYQLLIKNDLNFPGWTYGEVVQGASSGSITSFTPVGNKGRDKMFFEVAQGDVKISIRRGPVDAAEPGENNEPEAGIGSLIVKGNRYSSAPLEVQYSIGGSAQNGSDYVDHDSGDALNGVIQVAGYQDTAYVNIRPVYDDEMEFDETVTLTLLPGDGYVVDPATPSSATIVIEDNSEFSDVFVPVVSGLPSPVGIDYSPAIEALIVSVNYDFDGMPHNFVRIDATQVPPYPYWSAISGLEHEVQPATIKIAGGGFSIGDTYYGTGEAGRIGWLSADGNNYDASWHQLMGEANMLRGGLYQDHTGVWGNDLIVVTGSEPDTLGEKGVWRVASDGVNGYSTKVATIYTTHLEGVITLPADTAKWGPWAGKILTGDEDERKIYAVATSGSYDTYELGIAPEDFDLVKSGEDVYCIDYSSGKVMKLSKTYLADYEGDLLITQAGEGGNDPAVFIVHWDGSSFVTTRITYRNGGQLEQISSAPLDLPNL